MSSISFTLPTLPPPLSACFKNAGKFGRVKTTRYKAWIGECSVGLQKDFPGPRKTISNLVSVTYIIRRPDKRKRDLDNMLKALNDLLVTAAFIHDDSQIEQLSIRWDRGPKLTLNPVWCHIADLDLPE